MRLSLRSVLTAGAAILAAAAITPAMAQEGPVHVMRVQLPGGGIEQIEYTGNVAPRVVLVPAREVAIAEPMVAMPDPFAMMRRISEIMHRQEAVMLHQAAMMHNMVHGMMPGVPAGASGYTMVSTLPANGVCMRSTQVTFGAPGTAPRVVSTTAGDCGSVHAEPGKINVSRPVPGVLPQSGVRTIEARATTPVHRAAPELVAWNR